MHERAGTRPESISRLQWFALVTIAGAILLNTAPNIGFLKSDKRSTIAEAPQVLAAHVMARAELHTKPKSLTARVQVLPRYASEATAAESASSPTKEKSMTAEALPLPHPPPKKVSANLTFTSQPLPVPAPKRTPLPTRAPKEVRSRLAGSALQQTGRASWYTLDSLTASGEKMDDVALTAAHNSLPFGTKVLIENIANG